MYRHYLFLLETYISSISTHPDNAPLFFNISTLSLEYPF